MDFWAYFLKKFNKPSIQILRVWTKNAICRKFVRKFSKIFLWKLRKMHYFRIFFKVLTNPAFKFCAFGRKTLFVGNFLENIREFSEENCEKCIILAYFSKEFNKPFVNFLRDWTKNTILWKFWENFLKKIAKNVLI